MAAICNDASLSKLFVWQLELATQIESPHEIADKKFATDRNFISRNLLNFETFLVERIRRRHRIARG